MLNFVFQKIRQKKWMFISLLIGNLLMVAVAAASPMYSQAMLQRTLMHDLNNYQIENNRYPGTIQVLYPTYNDMSLSTIEETGQKVFEMEEALGVPALSKVTRYSLVTSYSSSKTKVDGAGASTTLEAVHYTGVEDHINITHGEMYSSEIKDSTFDVIVNERTFVEQNLVLNDVLELIQLTDADGKPYNVRIAGIFENKNAEDPYWMSSPESWSNVLLISKEVFDQLSVEREANGESVAGEWYIILDHSQMRADRAEEMLQVVNEYEAVFQELLDVKNIRVLFEGILEDFAVKSGKLNTTIIVLQIPIFVLLAAFIFMVSRQMLDIEQNEISIFKSRGAGRMQILRLYFLQSLIVAGISIVGGIPLGMLMCNLIGASSDFLSFVQRAALPLEVGPYVWLFAVVAALFSVCTMVLPVIRYFRVTIVNYKQSKNKGKKRTWWKIVCLDVVLLAVSLYGLYQFTGQEDYLMMQVADGASLDPILYLCSSLFMLGAGLLFLRLLPLIIRVIFWLGKKIWPPAVYASFLRIIRASDNQGFLVVFLVLTITIGVFNTEMARTINANSEDGIRYSIGADVVLMEEWYGGTTVSSGSGSTGGDSINVSFDEPEFEKYLGMDGIEQVTKVFVDERARISGDGEAINNTVIMGINTKEFGETAWFKDSLLPIHWYEYLNAISQDASAVLVSTNLKTNHGFKVGDVIRYTSSYGTSARGTIYGFVDYWPSFEPITKSVSVDGKYMETENYLVVAHLSQLQNSWGVLPYQVWINTKDSSQFLYDYAAETETRFVRFDDTSAQIIALKNDPVFQGTNGILTIGFIIVLLLCTTGFLIYWILSIKSRTLQFGIFRAMGMSKWEVLSMLLIEQLFISGSSIGAGVFIGGLVSNLFVPLIQIAYSGVDRVIPLEIVSEAMDFVRLGAVVGAMIILCIVILGILISKIKISQALKLGED